MCVCVCVCMYGCVRVSLHVWAYSDFIFGKTFKRKK